MISAIGVPVVTCVPLAVIHEHAGKDLHLIGLAPLAGETRLARAALVEIGLDVGLGQRNAGRAAVHHAADRGAMAFAEGGDAEKMAEGVERHRLCLGPTHTA